jgi:hypothetical protein
MSGETTSRNKTSGGIKHLEGQNVQRAKKSERQNVNGDKTSGDIMPMGQNVH